MLNPQSIAIVGASPTPGSLGDSVLRNLERARFSGKLHLINPKRTEISGRPCVASVMDLPEGVDCAVLAIPRAGVLEAVRCCVERHVGGVIIFSGGFAEDGPAGRAAQEEIAELVRPHEMVVEGPNCLGLVNYVEGTPLTFIDLPGTKLGERRGLAIVSQSGAMAAVAGVCLNQRKIGVSYSISTGNEAAAGVEDFVEHLLDDKHTHAIVMVVEHFRDPQRFLRLANYSRQIGKPIILLHPGRSAAARKSAETHSGALVGDDVVMRVKVQQAGVALVETLEELLDVAELFIRYGKAPAAGPAVLTDSGAFKALTLDFCASVGLELPDLPPPAYDALRDVLPEFVPPSNPLDLTAQGLVDPTLYGKVLKPLLADDSFGSVVLAIIMTNDATSRRKLVPILEALRDLKPGKPIVISGLDDGAEVCPELIDECRNLGIAYFPSAERVYRALARFTAFGAPLKNRSVTLPLEEDRLPPGVMPEYASKKLLARLGVPIPPSGFARNLEEAQKVAERIGFPAVLKAQSPLLSHKSDAGGVVLNLKNSLELAEGWATMHKAIAAARPGLELDGVLIETMSARGLELILGARNDPDWGPVLLIGFGGILAEALQDVRILPADLSTDAIIKELNQLKAAILLHGFRGAPAADIATAAEIIAKLGLLMMAHPEIEEADINPLLVYPAGQGAIALDALFVVKDRDA